jgi:hypothetical protein
VFVIYLTNLKNKIFIMKQNINKVAVIAALLSCTKYSTSVDGTANTATAGLSSSSLSNRVVTGFIVDGSTLPTLPTGALPPAYNMFRKILTYDTVSTVNKPPAYKAGDVITIVGFLKGDDYAISQRKINIGLYKAPNAWITTTVATNINVLQNAEDRYRSYQPSAQTGVQPATAQPPLVPNAPIFNPAPDTLLSLPSIVPSNTSPFTVTQVANELVGGINYNTYLVQLSFKIPATYGGKFVSGNVMSINFNVGSPFGFLFPAENAGNTNWIYAFRIR